MIFRLLGLALVVAVAAALVFSACVASCGVALVSVAAEGSPRIAAAVPLILPVVALRFLPDGVLPDEELSVDDPDVRLGLLALGALLRGLDDVGDAELVQIANREHAVLIAKKDGDLVVQVRPDGPHADAQVLVRAPLRALAEALAACDFESWPDTAGCDIRGIGSALISHARGSEVRVFADGAEVEIEVW